MPWACCLKKGRCRACAAVGRLDGLMSSIAMSSCATAGPACLTTSCSTLSRCTNSHTVKATALHWTWTCIGHNVHRHACSAKHVHEVCIGYSSDRVSCKVALGWNRTRGVVSGPTILGGKYTGNTTEQQLCSAIIKCTHGNNVYNPKNGGKWTRWPWGLTGDT